MEAAYLFPSNHEASQIPQNNEAPSTHLSPCSRFLSYCWEGIKQFFSLLKDALLSLLCCRPFPKKEATSSLSDRSIVIIPSEFEQHERVDPLEELKSIRLPAKREEHPPLVLKLDFSFDALSKLDSKSDNLIGQIREFKQGFQKAVDTFLSSVKLARSSDLEKVAVFINSEIMRFNQAIQAAMEQKARPAHLFDPKPYEALDKLARQWKELEAFLTLSELSAADLKFLPPILQAMQIPKEWTGAREAISAHVVQIAAKPVAIDARKQHEEVFSCVAKKFSFEYAPALTAAEIKEKTKKEFIEKLEEDVQGTIIRHGDSLNPEGVQKIIDYARQEYREFESRHSGKEEIETDPNSLFADLQDLVNIWANMTALPSQDFDLGTKIDLLTEIANGFPDTHAIFEKYPLKDAMEASLNALGLIFFSQEVLNVVEESDQVRRVKIESAFDMLAKKLGCKAPRPPEVVMDTSKDFETRTEIAFQDFSDLCQQIIGEYQTALQYFPPQTAAAQAAQVVSSFLDAIKDKMERNQQAKMILSQLPEPIAKAIKPHILPNALQKLFSFN